MGTREAVAKEILALKQNGIVQARQIVEWARANPDSMLHEHLEWDNDIAAEEYRIWQVRQLIKVCVRHEDTGEPLMVSLRRDRSQPDGGYRHIDDVFQSRDLTKELLDEALDELSRIRKKYQSLLALAPVWEEIDAIVEKLKPEPVGDFMTA